LIHIKGRPDGLRDAYRLMTLAFGACYDLHQFGNLTPLFGAIARDDRMFDAMSDMVAQDFLLRTSQGCSYCGNLRDDVDAISIFFDHPGETANLAGDPVEPLKTGLLDVFAHKLAYTPTG
jgi:hypothetical protein